MACLGLYPSVLCKYMQQVQPHAVAHRKCTRIAYRTSRSTDLGPCKCSPPASRSPNHPFDSSHPPTFLCVYTHNSAPYMRLYAYIRVIGYINEVVIPLSCVTEPASACTSGMSALAGNQSKHVRRSSRLPRRELMYTQCIYMFSSVLPP